MKSLQGEKLLGKKNSEMEAAPAIQIPIQRSDFVGQEHKLKVKGTDYIHDVRVTTTVDREGIQFKRTVVIKKIGTDSYQVTHLSVNQKGYEPVIETAMSNENLAKFKADWKNNWKPSQWSESVPDDMPDS